MTIIKKYAIDTRTGKKASFDLESENFTIHVIQSNNNGCIVIDDVGKTFFQTRVSEPEKAIQHYINSIFGTVKEWKECDEFGCYEQIENEIPASECCGIEQILDDYDFFREG